MLHLKKKEFLEKIKKIESQPFENVCCGEGRIINLKEIEYIDCQGEKRLIEYYDRNEWVWRRKKNKKITAEIALVHEIEKVEIFFGKYTGKEKNREFVLLETKPNEFYFVQYLGNLKWIDEETVFLEAKRGEEGLVINISTGSVKKVDCTF
ncbi:hypothetical protein [Dorea sp.]